MWTQDLGASESISPRGLPYDWHLLGKMRTGRPDIMGPEPDDGASTPSRASAFEGWVLTNTTLKSVKQSDDQTWHAAMQAAEA